ncbi:MAG: Rrf2 family transcriptional regulator [Eubacterium sp.]
MKLSKKSRYGLTALIDLSINSKHGHVALSSIAEKNGISPQYLEQVFAALRRAGIIKSIKGAQGGYLLNNDPKKITVASILKALDGNYRIEDEEISENSDNPGIAITIQNTVIDKINEKMDDILENLTLADLESSYQDYNKYNQHMYYI